MEIRSATPGDCSAIREFDPFGGSREREIAEGRCLVAVDPSVVGFASFRGDGCVGHPLVTYLAVAPDARRNGIARRLLAAVADRLGPRVFISTEADNGPMLALLKREGWREVGAIGEVNTSGAAELFFLKRFHG